MKLRTNALSWNPMEAFTFTAANEDGKCVAKVYSVGVGVLECGTGAKYSAGVCGFGCMVGQEFTGQVCVVLGKWCGCCTGQSLQCGCVWFWVHDMGATLVRVYSAGVCGFG